jgi:hypothetical protein
MPYLRETLEASTPPSIALEAIERYLQSKHNTLNLLVPLSALGLPSNLELEKPVNVEFVPARRMGRRKSSCAVRISRHLARSARRLMPPSAIGSRTLRPRHYFRS